MEGGGVPALPFIGGIIIGSSISINKAFSGQISNKLDESGGL